MPVLLAATILATGCGEGTSTGEENPTPGGAAGSGGAAPQGGGGAGGSLLPSAGTGGQAPGEEDFVVTFPEEGKPAKPGELCSLNVDSAASGRAAIANLAWDPTQANRALGTLEIAPEIAKVLVGAPTVALVDAAGDFDIHHVTVSAVSEKDGLFSFSVTLPDAGAHGACQDGVSRLTLRTELVIGCASPGGGSTEQKLHSSTDVHLCKGDSDSVWVSSGDLCSVCRIVAEMAPSPIVPEARADGLPLSDVINLRVVTLARVGNAVVLMAENDGGAGLDYDWHPSTGTVTRLAPDVVAWTVDTDATDPMIQAVATSSTAAAVASWTFNQEVQ